MKNFTLVLLALLLVWGTNYAQQKSAEELAKLAQNPLANMMSFPFQNNTTFGIGPFNRTANVLNIQPVLPFFEGRLITRTIIPIVSQPVGETESVSGVADINFTAFYSPPSSGAIWGVGPILTIPTGNDVSTKKWGLGPSFVILKITKTWVYGFLVNNVWSVAGDKNASDVNQFLLQYFVNYNFPGGWYLSFAPIITANWKAASGDQWTIPFGGGGGKIVRLGKLPLNLQAQFFYNAVRPEGAGNWSMRLQAQVLLPK